jgi:16S rRNA (uracil1498-N3)-methyltransferase
LPSSSAPKTAFADEERVAILRVRAVVAISPGLRIMRADTAAVAAPALVNSAVGDR